MNPGAWGASGHHRTRLGGARHLSSYPSPMQTSYIMGPTGHNPFFSTQHRRNGVQCSQPLISRVLLGEGRIEGKEEGKGKREKGREIPSKRAQTGAGRRGPDANKIGGRGPHANELIGALRRAGSLAHTWTP